MSHLQTVLGPVNPADAGAVMAHEHLLSLTPGPWASGGVSAGPEDRAAFVETDAVSLAVGALAGLPALGFRTVVDLSPYGVVGRDADGQNVRALQSMAERTGLNIVAGSSLYLEPFAPAWAREAGIDELHARFVRDATVGIGDTGVQAGIFGEQATGLGEIAPFEERALRAAARAQAETGLALSTHTTHGTMALEQLEILRDENADLERVAIGHLDIQSELDYVLRVLDSGASIAFDTIGKQHWDFVVEPVPEHPRDGIRSKLAYFRADESRADRIAELVSRGYTTQLLLAQDLTGPEIYLNPATHGQWGYAYLGAVFVPMLRERGIPQEAIDTMLSTNPTRMLSVA